MIINSILYIKSWFPNALNVSGIKNIYSKYFFKYVSSKPKIQISRWNLLWRLIWIYGIGLWTYLLDFRSFFKIWMGLISQYLWLSIYLKNLVPVWKNIILPQCVLDWLKDGFIFEVIYSIGIILKLWLSYIVQ